MITPKLGTGSHLCILFYVLINPVKEFYTGRTNNLKRRIIEHNKNLSFATKDKGPWKLIYYEASLNFYDALKREKFLKSGKDKKVLKQRLKYFLEESY